MKTLTANQVMQRLKTNPNIKLVMTLQPAAFKKSHIPGSINIWNMEMVDTFLSRDMEIIVYCSDRSCLSSFVAYKQLEQRDFRNVWRFAGGLVEWSAAGYPLQTDF